MNIECNICNKKYNSHQALRNHNNKYHKPTIQEQQETQKESATESINNESINDAIDYIMEQDNKETTTDEITLLMLKEANINEKEAKKINNIMKFVEQIEQKFLLRVFKEAGISIEDLVNCQKDAEVPPIYTNNAARSTVLGAYIKWLNQCLTAARAKNSEISGTKDTYPGEELTYEPQL